MFYPDFNEFSKLSEKFNLIPIYREIITDCETPVSTFIKLALNCKYSFLLESVSGDEHWGRYSFISWLPKFIFIAKDKVYELKNSKDFPILKSNTKNPFEELKKLVQKYRSPEPKGLPRFYGGAVGFVGYEIVRNFEDIPYPVGEDLGFPDTMFMFTDIIIIFDHFSHKTKVVATVEPNKKNLRRQYNETCEKINKIITKMMNYKLPKQFGALTTKTQRISNKLKSNLTHQEFIENVQKAKEYIRNGEILQVVLSQRFEKNTTVHPFNIYRCLRLINPSPYMYYLNCGDFQLIGSSPEILVRKEGDYAETKPIAGTRPRGTTEVEEKKYKKELLRSPKEKAEHIMLVDLGRNDLGRVCRYSTIEVPEIMTVERYSHVMHLVSLVRGKLKPDKDCFDLFRACFPAGTVTGAPKIRAMEIISELEKSKRGPYAGAVGYFSYSKNMDMAITIRTIVLKQGIAYVQAGAGIVVDSNPGREFLETRNKAQALLQSIELAEKNDFSN